jgi:hypothetical protein
MNCQRCRSNKMKTLLVIYGSGTTDRSSISLSAKGRVRTGSGRRQTKPAASASPPRGPSLILSLVGMLILFLFAKWAIGKVEPFAVSSFHSQAMELWLRFNSLVPIAVGALILIFGLLLYSAKRKKHAVRMNDWANTRMCLQFGGMWK